MEDLQDFLPLIVGIAIGIVIIGFVLRGTMRKLKGSSPVLPIEEAMHGLYDQISWIKDIVGIHKEGGDIVVYLEYYPNVDKLSFIPLIYEGYKVQIKLFDEVESIRLK